MRFVSHLLGREEPPQENSWMLLYIRLRVVKVSSIPWFFLMKRMEWFHKKQQERLCEPNTLIKTPTKC